MFVLVKVVILCRNVMVDMIIGYVSIVLLFFFNCNDNDSSGCVLSIFSSV